MTLAAGIAVAFAAAFTHALAHALLQAGRDKLAVRALIGLTGLAVMAPLAAVVARPSPSLWAWLLLSSAVHAVYQLVLIRAYEAEDFAVAYPMARGTAPLATAVLGIALLGERLTPAGMAGVAVVSLGLLLLALARRPGTAGLVAAVTAGLLTTAYTLIDARAIRLPPDPWTFIAWFFVLDGIAMLSIATLLRGRRLAGLLVAEGRGGIAAGLLSLATYSGVLLALSLLPAGAVSAIRETSVVFASALAYLLLGERMESRRLAGALLIALGGSLVVLGLVRA